MILREYSLPTLKRNQNTYVIVRDWKFEACAGSSRAFGCFCRKRLLWFLICFLKFGLFLMLFMQALFFLFIFWDVCTRTHCHCQGLEIHLLPLTPPAVQYWIWCCISTLLDPIFRWHEHPGKLQHLEQASLILANYYPNWNLLLTNHEYFPCNVCHKEMLICFDVSKNLIHGDFFDELARCDGMLSKSRELISMN